MKKQFIVLIVITLVFFSGCSNSTSVDNSANNTINESETTSTIPNESEQTELSTEIITIEDSQSEPEVHPNQYFLNNYDYYLYDRPSSWSSDYIMPIVMGFNYPYKADDYSNGGIYPDRYVFKSETHGNLIISMEEFIPTDNDELKTEIETPYGTAKIFWCSESSEEVACLSKDAYDFKFIWNEYDVNDYSGTIEKMLPIILTPIETPSISQLEIASNNITVAQNYDAYIYHSINETPTIGFNELDNWNLFYSSQMPVSGISSAYSLYQANNYDTSDSILITADDHIYKYVSSGRNLCEIIETEDIETPFGTAKIYYIKRTDTSEPIEEEIAIINNNGHIVTINLWNNNQNSFDGTFDNKLKEIIPLLFN